MRVADSYKDYNYDETKAYEKNGKMYVSASCKCSRCGGSGIYAVGVENGQIKPHPAYNGVCLQCEGKGAIVKEIRLYTDKEYQTMSENNEKARQKRQAEAAAKIEAEFQENKKNWLDAEGFTQDGVTYIVCGDSYSIKDTLKAEGWKYSKLLKWHRATPDGYEDRVIKVTTDEVVDFSAWGKGAYKLDTAKLVEERMAAKCPSNSEYIGEIKDKITDLPVIVKAIRGFENQYGYSHVITFASDDNILVWITATNIAFGEGDKVYLSGTIKDHKEYKGEKQTVMTRCKIRG